MDYRDPRERYERDFIQKAESSLKEMGYNGKIIIEQAHPSICPHCKRDTNPDPWLANLNLARASGLFADDL